jgi:C4-dicarboxylate-specific signal transduction histidine kinase
VSEADITAALGRANSAMGALTLAVSATLREAERREREADRREREAQAVIADAERRVEHLTAELSRERSRGKDTAEYRRGYHAGRAAAQRGDESTVDEAIERRRNR